MNLILIAAPGGGKGSLAKLLKESYNYEHLSTGELLRERALVDEDLKETLKKGNLVSDEYILKIAEDKLLNMKDKAFVLDGLPRTEKQAIKIAKFLEDNNLDNYLTILIDVDKDNLLKRITGRRTCKACDKIYNIYFDNVEENCPICNQKLSIRDDDQEEVFNNRYNKYLEEEEKIKNIFKEKDKLRRVDGNQERSKILEDVLELLGE